MDTDKMVKAGKRKKTCRGYVVKETRWKGIYVIGKSKERERTYS
jgi:hypothetical protein